MKAKLIPMLLVLLVGGLIAAGCGDDDEGDGTGASAPTTETTTGAATPPTDETETDAEGGTSAGGEQLDVSADPGGDLKFDKDTLSAKAGQVTITMANPSDVPHAVGIRGDGVDEDGETVTKGGESTASAELKAGEYEFYCPVAGHEAAGMKGTLTVK